MGTLAKGIQPPVALIGHKENVLCCCLLNTMPQMKSQIGVVCPRCDSLGQCHHSCRMCAHVLGWVSGRPRPVGWPKGDMGVDSKREMEKLQKMLIAGEPKQGLYGYLLCFCFSKALTCCKKFKNVWPERDDAECQRGGGVRTRETQKGGGIFSQWGGGPHCPPAVGEAGRCGEPMEVQGRWAGGGCKAQVRPSVQSHSLDS